MHISAASSARDAINAMRKKTHHLQMQPLIVAKCATSSQHFVSYGRCFSLDKNAITRKANRLQPLADSPLDSLLAERFRSREGSHR
jgi:hypothetical protein